MFSVWQTANCRWAGCAAVPGAGAAQLIPKLKLKGLGEEDRFFLYFAIKAMTLCTMLMYAPTIPATVKANLPFVTFVDSPEEAVA